MAHVEQRGNSFRLIFRYQGRRYAGALKAANAGEAEALRGGAEKVLHRLEHGLVELPEGADVLAFVLSDGKVAARPEPPPTHTLAELRDRYLRALGNGAMEDNSLDTVRMHLAHFVATLGEGFLLRGLTLEDLQRHIDRRARDKGHYGRSVRPVTLRKEVASLRACWNWGIDAKLVRGPFPSRGLRYPKADEKEPFQTWEEIERKVARGGLTKAQEKVLWDCLFLTRAQIDEFLDFARSVALHGFVYPMVVFAAHTGARRSEMLRALVGDVDFEGHAVLLREKKRCKERRTFRRVPLSPVLEGVLRGWLAEHPGGQHLFCHRPGVARSKTRRAAVAPLTRNEANDHFRRTVASSKWERLRGWHVLRHSFVSNCAARGIDQRLIDEWVGHTTEEMRRRYRHLFPDQQRQAIELVFGEG